MTYKSKLSRRYAANVEAVARYWTDKMVHDFREITYLDYDSCLAYAIREAFVAAERACADFVEADDSDFVAQLSRAIWNHLMSLR